MVKTFSMSAIRPESVGLIGEAPAFMAMLEHVSQAARLVKPVLVIGERGTGKELIASRLHYLSGRWDQQLIKVNCAALTESLLTRAHSPARAVGI
jgi:psp operon transcriptional activator